MDRQFKANCGVHGLITDRNKLLIWFDKRRKKKCAKCRECTRMYKINRRLNDDEYRLRNNKNSRENNKKKYESKKQLKNIAMSRISSTNIKAYNAAKRIISLIIDNKELFQ